MAEKHQQVFPLAPANGHSRSDTESGSSDAKELKRKKRIKLAIYIAIFVVFQCIVLGVFGGVIMRAKTPKLRINNIDIVTLNKANNVGSSSPPSFDMKFSAQMKVKNSNFGPYKFDDTTVFFTYAGTAVGQVTIPKGKAGFKSNKKINLDVDLSSAKLSNTAELSRDLAAGTLTLQGKATMTGKIELMFIMKKKKSTNMDCTIVIDVNQNKLQSLNCK
ncbi:late embryogenesis abundant protein At1g64065-like [Humulus lupulus]|uniref:late embryogenesis abundant protein At1g64065-like n=1 Tax=Humulus lupulus TaxID=3486 RepID=UPI002B40B111|nr:late embryogenesis abundant protein At1g64065-like [Humulus lupulus]